MNKELFTWRFAAIAAFILFILSFIFYSIINLGVDECASPCQHDSSWTFGLLIILSSVVVFIIYCRPFKHKKVSDNMKMIGVGVKTIFIVPLLVFIVVLITYLLNYERIACPATCMTAVIPHPFSKVAFVLGSITFAAFVYLFLKELNKRRRH